MYTNDVKAISEVIGHYFEGIFYGKVDLLEKIFHPQALLSGDINGTPYFKTLPEYLDGVRNRKSPSELGETFRMKKLALEIVNDVATAKLLTPMFEFVYLDYLSLHREENRWRVVNKVFTNLDLERSS